MFDGIKQVPIVILDSVSYVLLKFTVGLLDYCKIRIKEDV